MPASSAGEDSTRPSTGHSPSDAARAATMSLTSFASGALVTTQGQAWLNVGSLVPLTLTAAALAWLGLRRPRVAQCYCLCRW